MRAQAFVTPDGEVHVPAEIGPLDEGRGQALLAHELVHAAQQRRSPRHQPAEASSQGRAFEAEAQRMELAFRRRAGARSAADPDNAHTEPAALVPLLRAADPPPDAAEIARTSTASAEHDLAAGVRRAAGAVDAAVGPPAAEPSLDELVTRLYERISSRIKAELLIDRERSGSLVGLH